MARVRHSHIYLQGWFCLCSSVLPQVSKPTHLALSHILASPQHPRLTPTRASTGAEASGQRGQCTQHRGQCPAEPCATPTKRGNPTDNAGWAPCLSQTRQKPQKHPQNSLHCVPVCCTSIFNTQQHLFWIQTQGEPLTGMVLCRDAVPTPGRGTPTVPCPTTCSTLPCHGIAASPGGCCLAEGLCLPSPC